MEQKWVQKSVVIGPIQEPLATTITEARKISYDDMIFFIDPKALPDDRRREAEERAKLRASQPFICPTCGRPYEEE